MTRAAIYRRVSGRKQEDNTSLPDQLDRCTAWCKEHGYDIVADLSEVHSGAELEERPQMSRLLDMITGKEIDVVVAITLDRLSREQTHQGVILYNAKRHNVTVEFTEEKYEDSATGRFMQQTAGFIAEIEREKIRERTRRGINRRVSQGAMLPGANPLYGYQYADEQKSRYTEDPTTGPVVRRIWQEAIAGKTLRQIANGLTTDHVPTPKDWIRIQRSDPQNPPRGATWYVSTIAAILDNPAYYGEHSAFRWKSSKVAREDPVSRKTVSKQHHEEQAVGDRRVVITGAAPALVSPEIAQEVRQRLAENKATSARRSKDPERALLRGGYAKCGRCGSTLILSQKREKRPTGETIYIYRCVHSKLNTADPRYCSGVTIQVDKIDAVVWKHMVDILQKPEVFLDEAQRRFNEHGQHHILDGYKNQLKDIERREVNLRNAIQLLNGEGIEALVADFKNLQGQKVKALDEIRRLERDQQEWEVSYRRWKEVSEWVKAIKGSEQIIPYQLKRTVLFALTIRVVVNPSGTVPRYTIKAGAHGEIVLSGNPEDWIGLSVQSCLVLPGGHVV